MPSADLASQADLAEVRWALEDRIADLEQQVRDLSSAVGRLSQTLTATLLLQAEHPDAISTAEELLREQQ